MNRSWLTFVQNLFAHGLQLALEYDPAPPFDCGSPEKAGPVLMDEVLALQKDRITIMEGHHMATCICDSQFHLALVRQV